MAAKERPERKKSTEKPYEGSKAAIERAKTEAALARAKEEEKARLKAEEAPPEPQEAFDAAGQEIQGERLVRVEADQGRAGEDEGEQRISFIVRLTVDERGQPRRTEVEHAQSGKKESFPALDPQRLATFMEMCISPPLISEPTSPSVPSPVTEETRTPGPLGPASSLTVSDVRTFRKGAPGVTTLTLSPDEPFVIQAHLHLEGPEAPSLTAQAATLEMRVYAHEVTRGTSTLLITYSENLVENILEYTPQVLVPGLPPGLYRLVTLVTLQAPTKVVGHHDGPIVQVIGVQLSANPAQLLHGPLPQ